MLGKYVERKGYKMGKVKFVHIMPHQSEYNSTIVEMINDNPKYFRNAEHLFVMAGTRAYKRVMQYGNVKYERDIARNARKFRQYVASSDFVILHENSLISLKVLLGLRSKDLNKIVWCVWGHDLYPEELAKTLKRKLSNLIRKRISKRYHAIGIGFKYDALKIRGDYGNRIKILPLPYGYRTLDKESCKIRDNIRVGGLRVMVGHSAFEFLNHIEVLNKLERFKDEDIKVCLVLAYGRAEYTQRVEKRAIEIFGDKVEIIKDMMDKETYAKYLATVDVCILDYKHQAALGNIYMLLYMGKKLFLNRDGIIKTAMDLENIEAFDVDDINRMTFEEFSREVANPTNGKRFAQFYMEDKNYLEMWKISIDGLVKDLKRSG